jgi:cbb3-type cytochrome oxidase maturation protein
MGMLFVFTGLGLLLFIGAVAALVWSIRSGQLDDLDTPAMRVLTDDAAPRPPPAGTPPHPPSTATAEQSKTP